MSGIISKNIDKQSGVVAAFPGVPKIAGDKSPVSAGDMWYNSSSGSLRGYIPVGAWASGGNLSAPRYASHGCGTQTAGLLAGGYNPSITNTTEEYDGSSWSSGNNTGVTTSNATMHGTQTSALRVGGEDTDGYDDPSTSETYNGTGWTTGTDLPAIRDYAGAIGSSSTDAGVAAGETSSSTMVDDTYIWNGSSWATAGCTTTNKGAPGATGTTTAGLLVGGTTEWPVSFTTITETFDGTSWSNASHAFPASGYQIMVGGAQGSCMAACYYDNSTVYANTYKYDGSAWSASTNYPLTVRQHGGTNAASSTAALAFWGGRAPLTNATYEWTETASNVTITTS